MTDPFSHFGNCPMGKAYDNWQPPKEPYRTRKGKEMLAVAIFLSPSNMEETLS